MLEHLRSNLLRNNFEAHEADSLIESASVLELPTRHILVNQGEVSDSIYFLHQGICHASYLTSEGNEFSKEFYWEGDWIIGFESLIKNEVSPYLLETLTPSSLICLPISTLVQWKDSHHPIYIKLLETQLVHKENKERFMLLYTPEQRYGLFCEHYPELLERLNDYQIAAYLGITPISLSRIKKRIKD